MTSAPLVWLDLEMTGLQPDRHHILEAACIVTDSDLQPVDAGVSVIIHQDDAALAAMDAWCTRQHGATTGLTDAVRRSQVTLPQAEEQLLQYVQRHTAAGQSPLAGNSVHADRTFLVRHMPRLLQHLHYRIVDVSSLKELARRWRPDLLARAEAAKRGSHRALDDIQDSIAELKLYRDQFLRTEK